MPPPFTPEGNGRRLVAVPSPNVAPPAEATPRRRLVGLLALAAIPLGLVVTAHLTSRPAPGEPVVEPLAVRLSGISPAAQCFRFMLGVRSAHVRFAEATHATLLVDRVEPSRRDYLLKLPDLFATLRRKGEMLTVRAEAFARPCSETGGATPLGHSVQEALVPETGPSTITFQPTAREVASTPLPSHEVFERAAALCTRDLSTSRPPAMGHARAPAFRKANILGLKRAGGSWYTQPLLPNLSPRAAPTAILCLDEARVSVGQYDDGAVAYRVSYDAVLLDAESGRRLTGAHFKGGDPPWTVYRIGKSDLSPVVGEDPSPSVFAWGSAFLEGVRVLERRTSREFRIEQVAGARVFLTRSERGGTALYAAPYGEVFAEPWTETSSTVPGEAIAFLSGGDVTVAVSRDGRRAVMVGSQGIRAWLDGATGFDAPRSPAFVRKCPGNACRTESSFVGDQLVLISQQRDSLGVSRDTLIEYGSISPGAVTLSRSEVVSESDPVVGGGGALFTSGSYRPSFDARAEPMNLMSTERVPAPAGPFSVVAFPDSPIQLWNGANVAAELDTLRCNRGRVEWSSDGRTAVVGGSRLLIVDTPRAGAKAETRLAVESSMLGCFRPYLLGQRILHFDSGSVFPAVELDLKVRID